MGVIKTKRWGGKPRREFGRLSDERTTLSAPGPGPGLSAKRRPSALEMSAPEPDIFALKRRASLARDAATHKRPKPSLPRMPWDD